MGMEQYTQGRKWLLATALAYLGTPYVWGGDDPSGFDCSGFVLECLKSCGLVGEHEDHTADSLMRKFSDREIQAPVEGAILFSLDPNGKATHVVICLDDQFQIGASGGTSKTSDVTSAWRDNAYVKIRPIRLTPGRCRLVDPFSDT
jgi:peptidoglycan DL-endopeptidase LytE